MEEHCAIQNEVFIFYKRFTNLWGRNPAERLTRNPFQILNEHFRVNNLQLSR